MGENLSGNDKLHDFLKDDFAKFALPFPYSCERILGDELGWEGNLCANLFNPHFGGKIFLHVNAVVCAKNEVFPYMFHVHSKKRDVQHPRLGSVVNQVKSLLNSGRFPCVTHLAKTILQR